MPNGFGFHDARPFSKLDNGGSPLSSITSVSKISSKKQAVEDMQNDLVVNTNAVFKDPEVFSLEFPETRLSHKSKMKITFQNPSAEKTHVRDFVFFNFLICFWFKYYFSPFYN